MKPVVAELVRALDRSATGYCHFKSNNTLSEALNGVGDLDFLVDEKRRDVFETVIARLGFVSAASRGGLSNPFVVHYYGYDETDGAIIHLHVYYRLITGGSLVKNYHVPLESALLHNLERKLGVPVPLKEFDLFFFVVRKSLEMPSLLEHYLFVKDREAIAKELDYLREGLAPEALDRARSRALPSLDGKLLRGCWTALQDAGPLERVASGIRMRRAMGGAVRAPLLISLERVRLFVRAVWRARLGIKAKDRHLSTGGKVIAFVGAEASGKSTLSRASADWLGEHFDVRHVHLGKPSRTIFTWPLWLTVRCGVWVKTVLRLPKRKSVPPAPGTSEPEFLPSPFVLVLNALDRRIAARAVWRLAKNATIVIADRYPGKPQGQTDGPRIRARGWLTAILAGWEASLYRGIPAPDLVFHARAPLDTILARNRNRRDPEPDDFVRWRHREAEGLTFEGARQISIDTSEPLASSLLQVKRQIWARLSTEERGATCSRPD